MSLPSWSVKNRVAANLLAIVLLVSGLLAATTRLKLDLFPDVNTNFISIVVLDPTTSVAEEIERTITVPLEEELTNVRGVEKMQSISEDYFSTIFLQIESAVTNLDPVLNEVRQAVDKAKPRLPSTIEPPVVDTFDIPFPLIIFTIAFPSGYDVRTLRPAIERLERELKIIPGVSDVLIDGLDKREIWIELDPFKLSQLGISFQEVSSLVGRKNVNVVGGRMDTAGGQRLVRLIGEIENPDDLGAIPIKTVGEQATLLRDVATFIDRSEEERTLGRANLRPAITLTVVKKGGADAIDTVTRARSVFARSAASLPPEIETQALSDTTRFIRVRIQTVVQNGVQALLLVMVLLMLLLDWRLALVVAVGIPISFAGTFLVLYIGGYSINLLSLFAMIMALGMVVDDAIVIAENSYRYIEEGLTPVKAAVKGAQEVIWPVVGSVSTTVAAFLPLIWGEGIIGKFLAIVPVVVISTLAFSLVQAFIVLPSHVTDFVRRAPRPHELEASGRRGFWKTIALTYSEMREAVDRWLSCVIEIYTHLLVMCLKFRYLCITAFVGILVAAVYAVGSGAVPFKIFSSEFADTITVKVELPRDYSIHQTEQAVRRLEARIAEVLPADDVIAIITRVGARLDPTDQFLEYGTNLAMVIVDVDEENPNVRRPREIVADLRQAAAVESEFVKFSVKVEEGGPPVGRAVNVEVQGPDFARLLEIAEKFSDRLLTVPGTLDVGHDFPPGKTEYRIRVDESRAAQLGLDVAEIGNALQAGYRGLEASRMRQGNEEVILRVKTAERFRGDPNLLSTYRLVNATGKPVPLSAVAEVYLSSGLPRISRLNSERLITVSADLDERIANSKDVNRVIAGWIPEIMADYPDYSVQLTGENEDTEKSVAAMKFAGVVALLLIYALLAVITNSFIQPVVIMSVIPFGIVGVILGLLVMGIPMGLMSIMGTVALAGIVVNNSVVFVDFINRLRHVETGEESQNVRHQPFRTSSWKRWRSIILSARVRFRPVFLTTATTVAGLSNLAFTTTGQEQFLAPMAQAIIFGLTFASLLTMILIPCLYSVLDDLHALLTPSVDNRVKVLKREAAA